jgi:hypothetical protein
MAYTNGNAIKQRRCARHNMAGARATQSTLCSHPGVRQGGAARDSHVSRASSLGFPAHRAHVHQLAYFMCIQGTQDYLVRTPRALQPAMTGIHIHASCVTAVRALTILVAVRCTAATPQPVQPTLHICKGKAGGQGLRARQEDPHVWRRAIPKDQ